MSTDTYGQERVSTPHGEGLTLYSQESRIKIQDPYRTLDRTAEVYELLYTPSLSPSPSPFLSLSLSLSVCQDA